MDDLIPTILACPDYFKNKWNIHSKNNEFVWTALEDDAKMEIFDQYNKKHVYVFNKGAKITQWTEDQKSLMKLDGLKKIEYSND